MDYNPLREIPRGDTGVGPNHRNAARGPLKARARKGLRSAALSFGGVLPASRSPFIRCVFLHNVRAAQRGDFRRFLRELKNRGDIITTADLLALIAAGKPPSQRCFHLSLDDGFAPVIRDAVEIMADEQVTASLFVSTKYILAVDRSPEEIAEYIRPRGEFAMADWNDVRAAHAAGFEIGSHSHSHCNLPDISADPAKLRNEIALSKDIIERETGAPCRSFAWPRGSMAHMDAACFAAVEAAGYTACFSGVRGKVVPGKTTWLNIPRGLIEASWPPSHQRAFLSGYLDNLG